MLKVIKILVLSLMLVGYISEINGQQGVNNQSRLATVPKRAIQNPVPTSVAKKVLLNDEYIKVNSQDTIFVQTIQFPLMSDAEKVFAIKRITDYRSSRIKQFIDSFYNRDKVKDEYYQNFSYIQKWNFEIVYQSQTELALKLTAYEYTGGAHGNTTVKSFNIDLKNLKGYKLAEKFPNLNVDKIAEYCTNYCLKNNIPIFDNMIKASPDLFNVWNFTNEGLLLTFQPYSIAPYSSGVIEIHIPKSELKVKS